ncbi:MAG TPA: hypothetical protein VG873_18880 [Burkholderiales bacterium]|nr:hypothetical protein [Burkholderiales bacterium]
MSWHTNSAAWAVGVLALAAAATWIAFARQPGLGTFADDSVSYLVMAQVFSPWHAAAAPVASVFPLEAFHPPLFPLVLALVGASHDFSLAHGVNAVLLAACLPLVFQVALRWLGATLPAILATLAVLTLPALWIHVRGILSEPLFCLLLLATVMLLEARIGTRARLTGLAALFAALALTRTVGLAVAMGYALWAVTRPGTPAQRAAGALPALAALAAYALWIALRPAAVADPNAGAAADRLGEVLTAPASLAGGLARQALAMAEAWTGSLMLFWVEGAYTRPAVAGLVGVLALAGLCLRRARPDTWMVGAYLVTYLLWPFYDQMTRFLFPVVPLLVLYAFVPLARLAERMRRPALPALILFLVVLSLTAPALGFIHQRARSELPHAAIIDWYRTPDLAAARARAQVHLDLAADMDRIRRSSAPGDRVMWVAPAYVALLAERHAVAAPSARLPREEYLRAVEASGATLVYLSTYHPRDTIRENAWRAGTAALEGAGEVLAQRSRASPAGLASALLRLR